MKILFFLIAIGLCTTSNIKATTPVELSTTLLTRVINKQKTAQLEKEIEEIPFDQLAKELDTDQKRKAFWINVYNAYIIIYLREKPQLYEDRNAFFTTQRMTIAGESLSFDDIEHGIIRRSKVKLGLGIISNLFPGKVERKLRVNKLDPRIHFALNCGAKSCPPVRIYKAETIDQQLEEATKEYLKQTLDYSSESNTLKVTPLMSWFRGDFGGKNSIKPFIKKYGLLPSNADPKVAFLPYDWTIDLQNIEV